MNRVALLLASTLSGVVLLSAAGASADTLTATSCDSLYGLAAGTMGTAASEKYFNPTTCAAYQYLLTRYVGGGGQGVTGLANPQVQGITMLNPTFAVNLANLMKAAESAGYPLKIESAYRTCAGQLKVNPRGYGGNCDLAPHTKGIAADFIYPDNGAKDECSSPAHDWLHQNASTYHLGLYNDLHTYVGGECNHVEATSGSTSGTPGPGGGSGAPQIHIPTPTPNPNITTTPGLGGPTLSGQVLAQDYECLVSTYPQPFYVTIAAGTPIPSYCLTGTIPQSPNTSAPYCSGTELIYSSGSAMSAQQCPYGCSYGMCMQASQQQPATAPSSPSSPTSGGSAPVSSGSTQPGVPGITTTPTVTTSTITSPTLLPSTGTSSAALLQALANPNQNSPATASTSVGTSLTNSILQQLSPSIAGVTYATPASSLFDPRLESGHGGSNPPTIGSSGFVTTTGSGYDIRTGTSPDNTVVQSAAGSPTQHADTFLSNDLDTGVMPYSGAPAGDTNKTRANTTQAMSILVGLKADLFGALQFLTSLLHLHSSTPAPALEQGGE